MTWNCRAIDHAVTVFPDGGIGPCCEIDFSYRKPITEINNPNRFQDLKTAQPPEACKKCVHAEQSNLLSYRQTFKYYTQGIAHVDIRNTNECNLKCRYCGPHYSNQWSKELGIKDHTQHTDIEPYLDQLLTADLKKMYFTGGEPIMNKDHWAILQKLIAQGQTDVTLQYNTNGTTLQVKDTDIFDIWSKFKHIDLTVSIDAKGKLFEYIRSGARWHIVEKNLLKLRQYTNINVTVTPVISIMNIWHLSDFLKYLQFNNFEVQPIILYGPDYLSVNAIPQALVQEGKSAVQRCAGMLDTNIIHELDFMIGSNSEADEIFKHTLNHIMLLDKIRGHQLFELLPFEQVSKELILQ